MQLDHEAWETFDPFVRQGHRMGGLAGGRGVGRLRSPQVLSLTSSSIESLQALGQSRRDVRLEFESLQEAAYLFAKRLMDILISTLAIALLAPLMLLAAIAVKCTDRGPVFYVHTRVGLNGRRFKCLKFRSMVRDADQIKEQLLDQNSHDDQRTFKLPEDPRITRVGAFLRRSSIDELPQLFNVLIGDMSLVGPRPPVPSEVAQYSSRDMARLSVKPGLTCIWQVSGRSRLSFPEQLQLDLHYIAKRSTLMDIKLLALTVPAVIKADGAY